MPDGLFHLEEMTYDSTGRSACEVANATGTMKANVFRREGKFGLESKLIPRAGTGDAIVRVRLTTTCATDIHIVKGEYPVANRQTIGHEAVGTIHELGAAVLKPGGSLSSVGVYSAHLQVAVDAFGAGLSDKRIVSTLCPGGKERMIRLMRLVQAHRIDLTPLLTHQFPLDRISEAYTLFGEQRDNVLNVAIKVSA